jgi:hydrogenase expression/formation protein HypE
VSKFSLEVLNRIVFPHFHSEDPDILQGAVFGEDVALTRVGGDVLVSHVDPIVGAVQNIGWLAVHVACNDIATTGAPPQWIQLLVLVPLQDDEALLEEIMRDVAKAAEETGTSIIGGHTGYSAALTRPLVAVTALGTMQGRQPVLTKGAQPGDHILMTKGIALEGTAILAHDFSQSAQQLGLTSKDIENAKGLMSQVSVIPEAMVFGSNGATSMHDVTRGGLLETLIEMASLAEVALEVDYDRIPQPEIAARFAKAFDFDPLKMISSGTLVASASEDKLEGVITALDEAEILWADIGMVTLDKGVHIKKDSEVLHFQEIHPEEDELARMWTRYTPD